MNQAEIVSTLRNGYLLSRHPEGVELIQTHISYLLIAGSDVYKIKKPVNFGFLDFTTLEKRRHFCEEELRLNRRFAPHIYLNVVAITLDERGALSLDGDGEVIEYAVHMKRLPEEGMLKRLIAKPDFDPSIIDRIAFRLAQFHSQAETGGKIDEMGAPEIIRFNHEENFAQTQKYVGLTIGEDEYAFIRQYAEEFLRERDALLRERVKAHRIRDCHGDLHLEHICLDKDITFFDCIEFNERFRFSDVAAEVAFLTMDFDFNGYRAYAKRFASAYAQETKDRGVMTLLDFYRCYYAYVRGKVVSFRLDDPAIPEAERKMAQKTARRYFSLAYQYARGVERPSLIIMVGLTGTGKTVVAREIARRLDASLIQTDVIRKEMAGLSPGEHRYEPAGEGIYSREMSRRTYEEARARARKALQEGKSVIIDATHTSERERQAAADLAREMGAQFYIVNCTCPEEIVKERLHKRLDEPGEVSDGRWEIYLHQLKGLDPLAAWKDVLISVDTSRPREEVMATIFTFLG